MICPNCGRLSKRDFCIFCGYMKNGEYIKKCEKGDSDLEIYLGYDYDKIVRNKTSFMTFLLGPLYLCYKNYFLVGILLAILDLVFFIFAVYISSYMQIGFVSFSFLFILLYIFFRFTFWMTFDNLIYIYLIKRKIKKYKVVYKTKYKEIIANDKKRSNIFLPLFAIFLFVMTIIFIFLIFEILRKNY